MTGAAVTVTDRIAYSAIVSPEQAVAYCRRVLVTERGWVEDHHGHATHFSKGARFVLVPDAVVGDFAERLVLVCSWLVGDGIASRLSDVLRAMSQEPPPGSNYCPACDKRGVIATDGRHAKCGGPVIEGAEVVK